jgi:hypothetical protein
MSPDWTPNRLADRPAHRALADRRMPLPSSGEDGRALGPLRASILSLRRSSPQILRREDKAVHVLAGDVFIAAAAGRRALAGETVFGRCGVARAFAKRGVEAVRRVAERTPTGLETSLAAVFGLAEDRPATSHAAAHADTGPARERAGGIVARAEDRA